MSGRGSLLDVQDRLGGHCGGRSAVRPRAAPRGNERRLRRRQRREESRKPGRPVGGEGLGRRGDTAQFGGIRWDDRECARACLTSEKTSRSVAGPPRAWILRPCDRRVRGGTLNTTPSLKRSLKVLNMHIYTQWNLYLVIYLNNCLSELDRDPVTNSPQLPEHQNYHNTEFPRHCTFRFLWYHCGRSFQLTHSLLS